MTRKARIVGAWVVALVLVVGLVPATALEPQDGPVALARVRWQGIDDLAPLAEMEIPVYARLADVYGPYLLVGVRAGEVAALRDRGLEATVLDEDVTGASYYLAYPVPTRRAPDWHAYGQVLADDGEQVLLRTAPGAVDALLETDADLQAVTLDPKPLYPRAATHDFPDEVLPDPLVQLMMAQVISDTVNMHDRELAGELPVWVDGAWYTIPTRYTYSGTPIEKAGHYVGQRMEGLGMDVEYHEWNVATNPNVIGEVPGLVNPDEIFIIGAHLDDVQGTPGADDNASGSVATMLAADILSQYQWACTLRFAFWTGEEQGLLGSQAYAERASNAGENIVGYLNLDMIAWNTIGSNPDIDLLYNPNMAPTLELAQLFADVVDAYGLNLIPQLRTSLSGGSDHSSFWQYGYTAILGIEDQGDFNPYYHGPGDTPAHTDVPYFTDFVKASLGTFVHMSGCLIPAGIGALDGHVTAADGGAPLPDVMITMVGEGGANIHTTTDGSGYYTQTLVADTYTVTAEAYAYLPAVVTGVVVMTDSVTTQDLVLQTAPTYVVSGTVTEEGSGVPLKAEITFDGSPVTATTDVATGYYQATLPQGAYTMHVRADDHRAQARPITLDGNQTQSFVLEPLPCILLVDDDNNAPDGLPYYTAALDNLDYDYDVFTTSGASGPDADELSGYRIVIWYSGDVYGGPGSPLAGPNADDEVALATFLDGGGSLFLSSQDYLYDMGSTTFGQDYLGIASYTNDDGNASTKYGVTGDPIGDGLGPYPLSYPFGFMDYGDIVNPGAGASEAFRSSAAGGNNLDIDKDGGDWKTVFFGTSWVPIQNSSPANGQELMGRIVDWFGGCACEVPENLAFEWSPPAPVVGETVTFTGTADSDLPVGFTWDFGDGAYGTGATTSHAYSSAAEYTVVMTATNICGGVATSHTLTLSCESPSGAVFTWAPPVPVPGETVAFTGTAAGSPLMDYTWDLGDGQVESGITVTHVYTQPGAYPVVMTATNGCGLDVVSDTVLVEPGCQPVQVVTVTADTAACTAVLSAELLGSIPFSYTWDLGAWGIQHTPVATVTVSAGGAYPYTLTVDNCDGAYTAVTSGTFTVDCSAARWYVYLPMIFRNE